MTNFLTSLRIFISGAWLSYIALFRWVQPANYVASKIIMPLSQIIFFTYLGTTATGADTAAFYIIGNALHISAGNGIYGVTMTVGSERNEGTLIYLIASPANRFVVFMGRALFNVLDGMLAVVFGFMCGVLLLGLDLSVANIPGLALTILITTASTCGLGLLMGSLSLVTLNVMFVNNVAYFLLLLLSGANIPLDKLPAWVQMISISLPLTRGIQAGRLLVSGAPLADVWPLLAGELAIGLFYALLGFAFFSWFESQAKKRGSLEGF